MFVRNLPGDSALRRAYLGDDAAWTLGDQLQAATVDALHVANWQRSGDNKAPRPKPIPRPGVVDDTVRTIGGGKGRTSEEIDELFARIAERGE